MFCSLFPICFCENVPFYSPADFSTYKEGFGSEKTEVIISNCLKHLKMDLLVVNMKFVFPHEHGRCAVLSTHSKITGTQQEKHQLTVSEVLGPLCSHLPAALHHSITFLIRPQLSPYL